MILKGLMLAEMVIEHLAAKLGMSAHALRQKNLYQEGDRTHFGEKLEAFRIPQMWENIQEIADFSERKADVDRFNESNSWRKRGLSILPTKFGINFTAKFMNQVFRMKILLFYGLCSFIDRVGHWFMSTLTDPFSFLTEV
jgi:xanthine dehydrogenase/oxidase